MQKARISLINAWKIIFFVFSSGVTLTSCTRPSNETGKFSISLPMKMNSKLSTQAFDRLQHVSIELTAKDGSHGPLFIIWDSNGNMTAPATFDFANVPVGDKLVQVIAAYADSTNESLMQVYYGDSDEATNIPVKLTKADEAISISVHTLDGNTSPLKMGRVIGRYLTSASDGPTGMVSMMYTPAGNKPSMLIDTGVIFNGWMNLFMLEGPQFSYQLSDGSSLWNGPMDISSATFALSAQLLKVQIPASYRNNNGGNNGTPSWKGDSAKTYIYGFFGGISAGSSTPNYICDNSTAGTLGKLIQFTKGSIVGSGTMSPTFLAITKGTLPVGIDLAAGTTSNIYVSGGVSANTCAGRTLYDGILSLKNELINGNGEDSAGGFYGPFKMNQNTAAVFTVANNTPGIRSLYGDLLPGTFGSNATGISIDHFIAFKKSNYGFNNHPQSTPLCGSLSVGANGFSPAGSSVSVGSLGSLAIDLSISDAEAASGTVVAMCPVGSSGVMYPYGVWVDQYYFSSTGGGNGPYLRLEGLMQYKSTGRPLTAENCMYVSLNTYQQGNYYPVTGPLSVTFGGGYEVYSSDADCNSSINPVTSASFYMSQSSVGPFYLKVSTPPSSGSISFGLSLYPNSEVSYSSDGVIPVGTEKIIPNIPSYLFPDYCYQVGFNRYEADGKTLLYSTKVDTVTLSSTKNAFYSDSNCTSPSTGTSSAAVTFPSYTYTAGPLYIKESSGSYSTGTSDTISMSLSSGTYTGTLGSKIFTNLGPAAGSMVASHIGLTAGSNGLIVNECNEIRVQNLNSAGLPVPIANPITINLSSTGVPGAFFSSEGCYGAKIYDAYTGPTTDVSFSIYFMPASVGNVAITALSLELGSQSLTNSVYAKPSSFYFTNLPTFNGAFMVGSHEFTGAGSTLPLIFNLPSQGSFSCSICDYSSRYQNCYASVDCSSSISGGTFYWPANETRYPSSNVSYRIGYSNQMSSGTLDFIPNLLYDRSLDVRFSVQTCDQIISTASNLSAINLATPKTVCIGPNTVITKDSLLKIGSGANTLGTFILLGHSNGSSEINSAGLSGPAVSVGSIDGDIDIHNIKWSGLSTLNNIGIALDANSTTSNSNYPTVTVANNSFVNIAGIGILINPASLDIYTLLLQNNFSLIPATAGSEPRAIAMYSSGSGSLISNNSITNPTYTTDMYGSIGILINSTDASSPISGVTISQQSWQGSGMSYGVMAVADEFPPSLANSSQTKDSAGNLWFFGGNISGAAYLNSVWKLNPSLKKWTQVTSGSLPANDIGNYGSLASGTMGYGTYGNFPGGREGSASWLDAQGNLWIFGGYGYDYMGALGQNNDLWKLNSTSNIWSWMGGSNSGNSAGVYGIRGLASGGNQPGGRTNVAYWTDLSGNFWLFGGYGYDSSSTFGLLNDLWKFSPVTGLWTWMAGADTVHSPSVRGTKLVGADSNTPSARNNAIKWIDSSGSLWLFGGFGVDDTPSAGHLNDLWKFTPTAGSLGQWTWVNGGTTANLPANFGTMSVAASSNLPSSREGAAVTVDSLGVVWMFGGVNTNNSPADFLNDLWVYNPTAGTSGGMWTWVSGGTLVNAYGTYGVKGRGDSATMPGCRYQSIASTDSSGNFMLFGGSGYDDGTSYGANNLVDLWKFAPTTGGTFWSWITGSKTNYLGTENGGVTSFFMDRSILSSGYASGSSVIRTKPLYMVNASFVQINDSIIQDQASSVADASHYLMTMMKTNNQVLPTTDVISGVIFSHGANGGGIWNVSNKFPQAPVEVDGFNKNQFISRSAASLSGNNLPALNLVTTGSMIINYIYGNPANGNNRFCTSGATIWPAVFSGIAPSGTWDYSTLSGVGSQSKCFFTNAVDSVSGTCTQVCAP